MKFSCYKSDLAEALAVVIKAVAIKPQTPILSGIFIKAAGGLVELQSNNFSTGIIARIPANVEADGEIAVSGKRLFEFARNMPDDTITFSKDGNKLSVTSGGATVELLTMTPADFPQVKTIDTDKNFKLKSHVLKDLIRRTVFAAGKDDSRPVFTGCQFEIKDGAVSVMASDTLRFALAKETLEDACPDYKFIVPADTLNNLLIRLDDKDTESFVEVSYDSRSISFRYDNFFMTARLIEGIFPPTDRVIPTSTATNIRVDTAELKAAISFAALMAKDNQYNTVRLDINGSGLEVSAHSEAGSVEKFIEAQVDGADLDINFNADYILDALKIVAGKQISFGFNDKFSPALLTETDNPDFKYIVTPVRV